MIVVLQRSSQPICETAIQNFQSGLRGELIRPGDTGYHAARMIWNGMFDKRPSLIARCADTHDVVRAVTFARDHGLLVAVRGGGHSVAGHSTCDGGLMIDLSLMKGFTIDPQMRVVRAQPGLTLGELDRATQEHGLVVPSGQVSETGISGLTLGGGTGWLMRKWGLTIDNLLSVEIVTADGQVLIASERENPDLFWGVRGGGGNFGIVTSFEYRLHPLSTVLGGPVYYPLNRAREVLRVYRDVMQTAPDELTVFAIVMTVPSSSALPVHMHGRKMLMLDICYAGPLEDGMRIVAPLRQIGEPALDMVGPMPYLVRQSMSDESAPRGLQHYSTGDYLWDLSDSAIETIVAHMVSLTSPTTAVQIARLGGAVARIDEEGTAFSGRSAGYLFWIMSMWRPDEVGYPHIAWTRQVTAAMRPFTTGRAYVNAVSDNGETVARSLYGAATFERLTTLKNRYDPTNLFQLNHNIRPTVGMMQ